MCAVYIIYREEFPRWRDGHLEVSIAPTYSEKQKSKKTERREREPSPPAHGTHTVEMDPQAW